MAQQLEKNWKDCRMNLYRRERFYTVVREKGEQAVGKQSGSITARVRPGAHMDH